MHFAFLRSHWRSTYPCPVWKWLEPSLVPWPAGVKGVTHVFGSWNTLWKKPWKERWKLSIEISMTESTYVWIEHEHEHGQTWTRIKLRNGHIRGHRHNQRRKHVGHGHRQEHGHDMDVALDMGPLREHYTNTESTKSIKRFCSANSGTLILKSWPNS